MLDLFGNPEDMVSRDTAQMVTYRNDPKFSDRLILANSAVPDQTAPRGAV